MDDIYYTPEQVIQDKATDQITPSYNKNIREIIFIDDIISAPSDTILRAIIRE